MVHDDFVHLMETEFLPLRKKSPTHIRIDGQLTGGNYEVAGRFRHHGKTWKVHADTHYDRLMLAYDVLKKDKSADPFVEEPTKHGTSLVLRSDLRPKGDKYIYIYEDTSHT
jgi:hypothetical protein